MYPEGLILLRHILAGIFSFDPLASSAFVKPCHSQPYFMQTKKGISFDIAEMITSSDR
ncbi:MAG: hypothetical protein MZV63_55900 [Marinilabiliales bacterium]|nr:hypothetical protein [Marinilabiliales bacterium]